MKITRFEDIVAWQEARKLGQIVLRLTHDRNRFRNASLAQQILDCADSAMANIVEGFDSGSDKEFNRFLKIAYRSVSELQSHFYFALDSGFLDKPQFDEAYEQARLTKSQIGGFMRYLRHPRPKVTAPVASTGVTSDAPDSSSQRHESNRQQDGKQSPPTGAPTSLTARVRPRAPNLG